MRQFSIFVLGAVLIGAVGVVLAADNTGTAPGAVAPSADAAKPITTGDTIPDVAVKDGNGAEVRLRDLVSKQKTALIFYRGGWCPFCNKHLSEIASLQDEFAAAGYQVVGISADSPEDVRIAADKRDYPFTILSDVDMAAAAAFGVAFQLDDETVTKYQSMKIIKLQDSAGNPRYTLPVPAFYLIGTDGKVTFEHHDANYSVRISKEDVLKAIQAN